MAKALHSTTTFIPGALRLVLRGQLGWNKAKREREDKQDHKRSTEENSKERKKKEGRRKCHCYIKFFWYIQIIGNWY